MFSKLIFQIQILELFSTISTARADFFPGRLTTMKLFVNYYFSGESGADFFSTDELIFLRRLIGKPRRD